MWMGKDARECAVLTLNRIEVGDPSRPHPTPSLEPSQKCSTGPLEFMGWGGGSGECNSILCGQACYHVPYVSFKRKPDVSGVEQSS